MKLDKELDLLFERETKLTPFQIWKGWSDEETLKKWFCPLPWKVTHCEIDFFPGGKFVTTMEGPNGESMSGESCFLEIENEKKIVWSSALLRDYRPLENPQMPITVSLFIEKKPGKERTNYRAIVRHSKKEDVENHLNMGFHEGWGAAFKQLEDLFLR